MDVFFYGLFMDEALLAEKAVRPTSRAAGFAEGFALRIGQRATLVPEPGGRAYGLVMTVTEAEAKSLYAEESVADYRPEGVTVTLVAGGEVEAACYNLPQGPDGVINRDYAGKLLALASDLGLPEDYLDQIRELRD